MLTYVNGLLLSEEAATVSVLDHSFLYGDGVFEGISVDDGRIFRLDDHLARFLRSAAYLRIRSPLGLEELRDAVVSVVASNSMRDGYVRPILTRGVGPMGIGSTKNITVPNLVIVPQVRPRLSDSDRLDHGLKALIVATRRTPPQCLDPRVKSNNYLNQILAKWEQWDAGADAAIMLDTQGYVSECSGENVFVVSKNVLLTPPEYTVLNGITRQSVMTLWGENGGTVREQPLTAYDLYTADEVFITATLIEVAALSSVDGRVIGSGKAGPVTRSLLALLRDMMAREGYVVDYGEAGLDPTPQAPGR